MENFQRVDTQVIANQLALSNQLMGKLVGIMSAVFPRSVGTFTMDATSSKVITDAQATTSSIITLMPLNDYAGTLMGSAKSFYYTRASGSFTVTTANGVAATGLEEFAYAINNPL